MFFPTPISQEIVHIEKRHWNLWWKTKGEKNINRIHQFTPEEQIPNDAELVLEVQADFTIIPPQLMHNLQVEIMGQRASEGNWESRKVGQTFFDLYFDVPLSITQGSHQVCLVATLSQHGSETKEYKSPHFDVRIARTYKDLRK